MLAALLKKLGCPAPLLLNRPLGVAVGGGRDLAGNVVRGGAKNALRLVRRATPGAKRMFEDTPIVHPDIWYPLQAKRVRYFRKPDAPSSSSGASGAPGAQGPTAAAPAPANP
jgi:hypothetical protein